MYLVYINVHYFIEFIQAEHVIMYQLHIKKKMEEVYCCVLEIIVSLEEIFH